MRKLSYEITRPPKFLEVLEVHGLFTHVSVQLLHIGWERVQDSGLEGS